MILRTDRRWRRPATRCFTRMALAAAWAGLEACAHGGPGVFADHLHLDTSQVACPVGDRTIDILQNPPNLPFHRVAYVEAFAAFYANDEVHWDRLRRELCKQALEVGADAIIELRVGGRDYSRLVEVGPFEVSTGGQTKKLTGVAIRYGAVPDTHDVGDRAPRVP